MSVSSRHQTSPSGRREARRIGFGEAGEAADRREADLPAAECGIAVISVELGEQVAAVVWAGARLGVVLDAERFAPPTSKPSQTPSLRLTCVSRPGRRTTIDGEVGVLAGDHVSPVDRSLDGVVAAVTSEREPRRRPAEGARRAADGRGRFRRSARCRPAGDRRGGVPRGSPGPFDRNTPSGSRAKESAAVVDAGTTSTRPSSASWRTICSRCRSRGDDSRSPTEYGSASSPGQPGRTRRSRLRRPPSRRSG